MKYLKRLHIIIITTITFFVSCSNDESDKGVIRYTESNIDTCFIYVGSETGGKELHLDSIRKRFDLIFPTTVFESFSNTSFSFIEEDKVFIEQAGTKPEMNNYFFSEGSFYLYNNDTPIYYGEGNEESLNVRQHYIAYRQNGDKAYTNIQSIPQKIVNKEDISKQTPFGSIENMKSKADTLIWCTRISSFK